MQKFYLTSLTQAIKEQKMAPMMSELEAIVPDLTYQYTNFLIDTPLLELKVRPLHAFQASLIRDALIKLNLGAGEKYILPTLEIPRAHISNI